MQSEEALAPADALRDIRGIMERSAKFLSLSGWSGIWAGCTAVVAAFIAYKILNPISSLQGDYSIPTSRGSFYSDEMVMKLLGLAICTFIIAFIGAYYFTWRKARASKQKIWSAASRQLMWQIIIPLVAGGVFCLAFLYYGTILFISPACLAFYGLALVNGSKYTLGEIRWLGYLEIVLGCICLFIPNYGLIFMAIGFGILHILYGIIMWNKYDKVHTA